ncbi:hypothetical protein GCM10010156_68430 [Planobispora rosea]|uniref:DUF2637 domain-containing protein n=1 Tax=Planobispora rosea TaxID=35762 RepID=A0A8J3WG55_PLARO|nr:DUF2637 domain-containing protein [Planobispora rosea]GGT00656.1 hypothetical protein GCM10010156_68430 [Planobispora rosea]GIH88175.1 hypothetical protein Pro02_65830 [Planobispora rosea]
MTRHSPGRVHSMVLDSAPVVILAVIAAVGSFTHISELAAEHGQRGWQSWAVAVCIDLMCVMATRELQRDKRTGRPRRGPVSWPSLVLAGGIVLTLAANLARAETSVWGWICAAMPAVAFLVAISMLERRASHRPPTPVPVVVPVAEAVPEVDAAPLPTVQLPTADVSEEPPGNQPGPSPALLTFARRLADEHSAKHGRPVTADLLRTRMGISGDLAADLLRQIAADPT